MRSDPEPTDVGFTLLELMVVVAILLLIAGFAVPALTTLSGGSGLSSGGRIVANLLTVARSEAINRHASVRFEVAITWPSDSTQAYRKIALVQHDFVLNTDTQITGWQTLPAGVVINPTSTGNYFFAVSQSQSPQLTRRRAGNHKQVSGVHPDRRTQCKPSKLPGADCCKSRVHIRFVGFYSKDCRLL